MTNHMYRTGATTITVASGANHDTAWAAVNAAYDASHKEDVTAVRS